MSGLRSQPQAVAAGSTSSKHRQHRQHCRTTSLTSVAATVWQAVCARPSACQASRHAAWMQVSAVRQWEHACSSTAVFSSRACSWRSRPARCPSAGDSVHPALAEHIGSDFSAARGSFSTKIQNDTARDQGSVAMVVHASDASMGKSDALPEKTPRL